MFLYIPIRYLTRIPISRILAIYSYLLCVRNTHNISTNSKPNLPFYVNLWNYIGKVKYFIYLSEYDLCKHLIYPCHKLFFFLMYLLKKNAFCAVLEVVRWRQTCGLPIVRWTKTWRSAPGPSNSCSASCQHNTHIRCWAAGDIYVCSLRHFYYRTRTQNSPPQQCMCWKKPATVIHSQLCLKAK